MNINKLIVSGLCVVGSAAIHAQEPNGDELGSPRTGKTKPSIGHEVPLVNGVTASGGSLDGRVFERSLHQMGRLVATLYAGFA